MVKSLKKNDSFDWQFVSREKADHEIKMVNTMLEYTYQANSHMKSLAH